MAFKIMNTFLKRLGKKHLYTAAAAVLSLCLLLSSCKSSETLEHDISTAGINNFGENYGIDLENTSPTAKTAASMPEFTHTATQTDEPYTRAGNAPFAGKRNDRFSDLRTAEDYRRDSIGIKNAPKRYGSRFCDNRGQYLRKNVRSDISAGD